MTQKIMAVGFVGGVSFGGGFSATGCTAHGDVDSQGTSGGFAGYVNKRATFTGCRADGTVKAAQQTAGGFVGNADAVITFRSCVARGGACAASETAGGFIGNSGNAGVLCDATPTPVNLDGVTVKVLASESLVDWSAAVETELTVDSEGRVAFQAFASAPQTFFKLQAEPR